MFWLNFAKRWVVVSFAKHSVDFFYQIVDRYKDYKIPMMYLNIGQTIQQLRAAGVQIEVTAERAKAINRTALKSLLKIVDHDPAESTADMDQTEIEDMDGSATTSENLESEAVDEELEAALEGLDTRLAKIVKKKVQAQKESVGLQGKFIDLVDVIPHLPEKGDFRVENIKSSPYFFS